MPHGQAQEEARHALQAPPVVRRAAALAILAVAAPIAGAAPAGAHGVVGMKGATITYSGIDDPTLNTVKVTEAPGSACGASRCLEIADPAVEPGMDAGPCTGAGGEDPHAVFCPWKAGARIRMDLGELDDRAEVDVPIPADLRGGPGDDTLIGGSRGDQLLGGSGADTLDGRGGDDVLAATDGAADHLTCGTGLDAADADAADAPGADCEDFTTVADPNSAPPRLDLRAARRGRALVARLRTATAATVTVSGRARAGARRYVLGPLTASTSPGAWATVKVPLRARRGRLTATLVATLDDGAGNAARTTVLI